MTQANTDTTVHSPIPQPNLTTSGQEDQAIHHEELTLAIPHTPFLPLALLRRPFIQVVIISLECSMR
ncbi:hypothetical protein PGTUg99_000102 [Puccinia graminis f. sp. tritici]|uniref:Uncharacterized protein n=1 Tax=Puccinia graminis f. sp. tritici TaxID=56615 RepID=A0A5B0P8T7_PUCGR|nr:hypothetical protein PGTUg99_000102 [Puccinia graminis f. sp. tritici]